MDIFSFPLDVERNPAQRLSLPKDGFVQVIRADGFATIRKDHSQGHGIPAAPGVVLPIGRSLYLQNAHTGRAAGTILPQRGVLLLAYYESREAILDLPAYTMAVASRQLANAVADNATVRAIVDPIENGMHVITGVSFGFSDSVPAGLTIAGIAETPPGSSSGSTLWTNFVGVDNPTREVFFRYPIVGRAGWAVELNLSASGTAGVFGSGQIMGGTIFV